MGISYITPTGSGDKSGSSWQNAAAVTSMDAMIKKAGSGGTVLLAADKGDYALKSVVNIATGGVTIKGMNTNGTEGEAHFTGTRAADWTAGAADGNELFRIQKGADNLTFKNLQIDNTGTAFRVVGDVKNLTVQDVDAHNVQRFFDNLISGTNTTATISGLTIKNVDVDGFSKGVIRLQYDTNNVLIQDVNGDSLRQTGDNFAMGIHLEDTVHDVTMQRVVMDNATDDKGTGVYWNGDGFTAEGKTYNLTFIDTVARGNTDGGYDIKADHVTMLRAVAEDNGKNFRFWGTDITVTDSVGLNPNYRGGSSSQAQVWIAESGQVKIVNSSFSDSGSKTTVFQNSGSLELVNDKVTYAGLLVLGKQPINMASTVAVKVDGTGLNSLSKTYLNGDKAVVYAPEKTSTVDVSNGQETGAATGSGAAIKIVTTGSNETFVGTSKSEMFIFDQSKATGADTIKGFGPTDFLVFSQKLGDADGDGLTGFGKDNILQLANGGSLVVQGLVKDLRLVGQTDEGFVYGDSAVWKAGSVMPAAKETATHISTTANEIFIASNAKETFYFDVNAGPTGKDVIRGLGATDLLVMKKMLVDGNGDGLIAPGKNGLDLGDKKSIVSMPELTKAGLRYLGQDSDGHVYADAAVRPKGALEGRLNAADTLTGGKTDTATDKFFFDTAVDRQLGADKIVNFGVKDVVVSTSLLGSNVVGSKLAATNGNFGLHDGVAGLGSFSVNAVGGAAVSALEYDGMKTVSGIDYYVYSHIGSAVGLEVVA